MQGPEAGKGEAAAESMDSGGRGEGRGRRGEEETSTGGSLILNADMDSSPQHSTPIPSFLPDIASPDAAIREGGAVGATLKATSGSAVEQIHEQGETLYPKDSVVGTCLDYDAKECCSSCATPIASRRTTQYS